jgi:putative membrane protein
MHRRAERPSPPAPGGRPRRALVAGARRGRPLKLIVDIVITCVGLLLAGLLVPGVEIEWGDDALAIAGSLLVLAVLLGAVNASLGRLLGIVAVPLNLLTLGLFSVLIDAGLLLLVAFLVDATWQPLLVIGGFPPELSLGALGSALVAALVITLVSTLLHRLVPGI